MATHDPNRERQDRNVEEPGDTGAADIVGRTGEQMPRQSHDGLEPGDHYRPVADTDEDDEDVDGYPVQGHGLTPIEHGLAARAVRIGV